MHLFHTPLLLPMLPMHLDGAQKVMRNAACRNSHAKAKRRRYNPAGAEFPLCKVCSFHVTDFCLFSACTADHSASLHPCVFQTNLQFVENESVHGAWNIRIIPGAAAVAKANIIYVCYMVCLYLVIVCYCNGSPLPL